MHHYLFASHFYSPTFHYQFDSNLSILRLTILFIPPSLFHLSSSSFPSLHPLSRASLHLFQQFLLRLLYLLQTKNSLQLFPLASLIDRRVSKHQHRRQWIFVGCKMNRKLDVWITENRESNSKEECFADECRIASRKGLLLLWILPASLAASNWYKVSTAECSTGSRLCLFLFWLWFASDRCVWSMRRAKVKLSARLQGQLDRVALTRNKRWLLQAEQSLMEYLRLKNQRIKRKCFTIL